ncbi:MAG: rhodanese-like domain-containing protein, partial [Candidatus Sericytochromatia bacterium]|nr:rhodanese-like domain-containing protein [Candidatus Sericytochromatia bacterium]
MPLRAPIGASAASAIKPPLRANFATVTVDDLRAMPVAGCPRLIDVRETDEYAAGHVAGAVNVPLATVAAWAGRQAKPEPLLVICQSGRRSTMACQTLVDQGFERITNVAGDTGTWFQHAYPVATGARRA